MLGWIVIVWHLLVFLKIIYIFGFGWYWLRLTTNIASVVLIIRLSEMISPADFAPSANCCAVKAKSHWPRSHQIRRAATSQVTTQMTQTRPSTPMRRWSWSITCWRSLPRPRRRRNSTWRSATAHRQSDPHKILWRPTTNNGNTGYSCCRAKFYKTS